MVGVALLGLIISGVLQRPLAITRPPMIDDLTKTIGSTVLTRFVLPFELLALLMVAALLSAIYFARPDD